MVNWSGFWVYLRNSVIFMIPWIIALWILSVKVFNRGWKLWRKLLLLFKSEYHEEGRWRTLKSLYRVTGTYRDKRAKTGNNLSITYELRGKSVASVTVRKNKRLVFRGVRLFWVFPRVTVYRKDPLGWELAIEVALMKALSLDHSQKEYRHIELGSGFK